MLGPIDYIAVGFDGNNFDGSILSELSKAVGSGVIRVIDLLFVIKDKDGNVEAAEIIDQSDELKAAVGILSIDEDMPLLTEDDMKKLAKSMENNTSGGVLVIEQLWAKGLKKALIDAGGILIDEGRVHSDKVDAAIEEIEQSKSKAKK